ncbi:hypothetical protein MBANPS3_008679 [Mucor bainieri]
MQAAVKKAGVLDDTEKQPSKRNKGYLHHRTAKCGSSKTVDIKKEEDDYKDAHNALKATYHENDTSSDNTIQVKAEIKQEDMDKASLHATTPTNHSAKLHRTYYFWLQLLLQKLRHSL